MYKVEKTRSKVKQERGRKKQDVGDNVGRGDAWSESGNRALVACNFEFLFSLISITISFSFQEGFFFSFPSSQFSMQGTWKGRVGQSSPERQRVESSG